MLGGKFWAASSSFLLYCGPCLHCLPPRLLTALHPHPNLGQAASVSSCQGGNRRKGGLSLGFGHSGHLCPGTKRTGLQRRLRDTHQLRETFLRAEEDLLLLLPSPPKKCSMLLRLQTYEGPGSTQIPWREGPMLLPMYQPWARRALLAGFREAQTNEDESFF